jgi:hypothetical protein
MTKPFLHLTPRAMRGLLPGEESSKSPQNIPTAELLHLY